MTGSSRQGVKLVAAIGLFAIAAGFVFLRSGGRARDIPTVYYFDLTDGRIFTAPTADPPINAPGGAGQGVRVMLLSCGACQPDQWQIVHLEKIEQQGADAERIVHFALPPADDEQVQWHPSNTMAGAAIGNRIAEIKCPPGKKLTICEP